MNGDMTNNQQSSQINSVIADGIYGIWEVARFFILFRAALLLVLAIPVWFIYNHLLANIDERNFQDALVVYTEVYTPAYQQTREYYFARRRFYAYSACEKYGGYDTPSHCSLVDTKTHEEFMNDKYDNFIVKLNERLANGEDVGIFIH